MLLLVEQRREYMSPNHSKFDDIEEEQFLVGTRVLVALEKVEGYYSEGIQTGRQEDSWRLCELCSANRPCPVCCRPGIKFFCPAILMGGDDHAPMELFDMLFDGLFEKGWMRGSEMGACKSEYQSFVQEQRQLEITPTRSRHDGETPCLSALHRLVRVYGTICANYVLSPNV